MGLFLRSTACDFQAFFFGVGARLKIARSFGDGVEGNGALRAGGFPGICEVVPSMAWRPDRQKTNTGGGCKTVTSSSFPYAKGPCR